ncbi:single-stranded DNA-binding protein [Streptomyces sp. Ru73]|nr:single-stranded DNA-binding protein [Streptomyces sp. Ru73]
MTDTMVTLTGNAATAVEHRYTKDGAAAARFRMACTPRRFDREQGRWTDGPTSFYTVRAWRALADNLAASVAVGEPLLVRGRLTVREGENPPERGGGRWFAAEVDAVAIGHDLTRGTAAFRRAARVVPLPGTDAHAATTVGGSSELPGFTEQVAGATEQVPGGAGERELPQKNGERRAAMDGSLSETGGDGGHSEGNGLQWDAAEGATPGPHTDSGGFTNGTTGSGRGNGDRVTGIGDSGARSDSPEKVPVS